MEGENEGVSAQGKFMLLLYMIFLIFVSTKPWRSKDWSITSANFFKYLCDRTHFPFPCVCLFLKRNFLFYYFYLFTIYIYIYIKGICIAVKQQKRPVDI